MSQLDVLELSHARICLGLQRVADRKIMLREFQLHHHLLFALVLLVHAGGDEEIDPPLNLRVCVCVCACVSL